MNFYFFPIFWSPEVLLFWLIYFSIFKTLLSVRYSFFKILHLFIFHTLSERYYISTYSIHSKRYYIYSFFIHFQRYYINQFSIHCKWYYIDSFFIHSKSIKFIHFSYTLHGIAITHLFIHFTLWDTAKSNSNDTLAFCKV